MNSLPLPLDTDVLQRYWSNVRRQSNRCWLWVGSKTKRQPRFKINGIPYISSRLAYSIEYNIDPLLQVLHTCDNPMCVNPKHLFLGTQFDNIQDALGKGRLAHGEQHGMSKFVNSQIVDIRFKAAMSVSWRSLAKEYNVEFSTIARIIRRETWSHIP